MNKRWLYVTVMVGLLSLAITGGVAAANFGGGGGAAGGSFIGGLALGKAQDDAAPAGLASQFELPEGLEQLGELRDQFVSGEFQIPEGVDLDQIRSQFLEGGGDREGGVLRRSRDGDVRVGGGDGAPGDATFVGGILGGDRPVAGEIAEIGPDGFVVEDEDGNRVSVTLAQDGVIRRQVTMTVDELEPGMQVVAFGSEDDEGKVEAAVVQIVQ
jgi:hypothetical protein